ncbi:macrophage colony-stimulating factor 1 isoform X1 [Dasypus novemcinctus]|uniref:macrophage colony-stimulating factor 1 isoform X1 n=1 Tax=Dasypus novemcinctus TaxID=9361 RepID=UPI00265F8028|nr:macrophage colony-stimulating factor 1 isoform X1 [Dasypus novemcinctus]
MSARGAAGRCPPQTWLGPWMLLACLLVSRSVAKEVLEHCSHVIGNGHLALLQKLIDSQMETSCQIAFEFVDQEQLSDPVCYLKKAFLLMQDIMEDTVRFKDNTPNAIAIVQLQELSLRLKSCFTKDYDDEQDKDKTCVRTFYETPLQLLEKIKNVFNETKNLLKNDWNVFSKNCSNSFAKCSSQNVATKPDCNCLYPKTTPSRELASAPSHQPLAPSVAPLAGLTQADAAGTEGGSFLPGGQPLRMVDPGSTKQRPPRSTCQSFEPPESPGVKGSLAADASGPTLGDILDPAPGASWAPEEASGEASESPVPQGSELPSSGPGRRSVQAPAAGPSILRGVSPPPPGPRKRRLPAPGTGSPLDGSPGTAPPRQRGLGGTPSPSAQRRLPRRQPLGELEGRSTRDRRSAAEPDGGPAGRGARGPQARFNPVPLTAAGDERQHGGASEPQLPGFAFHLLAPSALLVLLAVGGLLFYRRRRRSRRQHQTADSSTEQPEGSPLTQDEDRQVEVPV